MRRRETYSHSGKDGPSLLPEVAMLGWSCFPRTQVDGLTPHSHDAYELCLLVDGSVVWWVEGERFTVGRGEVFFTRPGEPHGGWDRMMHPCELYWVQVRITEGDSLPGLTVEATNALRGLLDAPGPRCFSGSPELSGLFAELMGEFRCPEPPVAETVARALLHCLLTRIARDRVAADHSTVRPNALSPEIAAAREWMASRLAEPFCIAEAAEAVGLHPSRFHDRFLAEVGYSPAEWRVRQRVAAGERLLTETDETVTEIAFMLGFASSQYFATAFKKYTGRTPSEYRHRRPRA